MRSLEETPDRTTLDRPAKRPRRQRRSASSAVVTLIATRSVLPSPSTLPRRSCPLFSPSLSLCSVSVDAPCLSALAHSFYLFGKTHTQRTRRRAREWRETESFVSAKCECSLNTRMHHPHSLARPLPQIYVVFANVSRSDPARRVLPPSSRRSSRLLINLSWKDRIREYMQMASHSCSLKV